MPRCKLVCLLAVPLLLLTALSAPRASLPCALNMWPHLFYSGFEDGNLEGMIYNPATAWGPGNNNTALEVRDLGCDVWTKAWIITGFNWTDCVLQASVQFKEGTCNNLGLMYHFQNPNNFYLFMLSDGQTASLLRMCNGTIDRSQSVAFAYQPDRWYVMRINASGARHRAFVNGVQVLEWDDTLLTRGTGGLIARGTRAWFDNVTGLIRPSPPLARDERTSVSLEQEP